MGLLYPFPADPEETGFVQMDMQGGHVRRVTLKSYGLPWLFWGYAAASLAAVFFLWLAVRAPLAKLAELGDGTDLWMVRSLQLLLALVPLALAAFLLYEKRLVRSPGELVAETRFLGLLVWRRRWILAPHEPFFIRHFLETPNMARLRGGDEALGFQNKGYFTLWARTRDGDEVEVDRHSRRADLEGVKSLLSLPGSEAVNHAQ